MVQTTGKSLTAGQHVYDKLLLMVDAWAILLQPISPLKCLPTIEITSDRRDLLQREMEERSKPGHINLEQSYLSSVFSELSRLGDGRIRTHWRTCENSPSQKKRCMAYP